VSLRYSMARTFGFHFCTPSVRAIL